MSAEFWSDVVSTVIGAGVGAFLAFELERRRRNAEQRRQEVGRCHQLACLLVNRLNVLQDFHEYLFLNFEKEHGGAPKWDQVPALDGAPERTDEIPLGDYAFLVDGREHESDAPALLRRVQLSTINTNALFARLAHRNRLWHERHGSMPMTMQLGEAGVVAMEQQVAMERSLKQLTSWVRQDLEEEIRALQELFDVFHQVMHDRYPKEKVLHFRPTDGGPPLGRAGK